MGGQRNAPAALSPEKTPLQEAEWEDGSVWTGAENLAVTGIRSPDRPARSESLYRLSFRGPHHQGYRRTVFCFVSGRTKLADTSDVFVLQSGV